MYCIVFPRKKLVAEKMDVRTTTMPLPLPPKNQFLRSGSEETYEPIDTVKACVMRVDLPGCAAKDLDYWVDGDKIHFFADELAMPEYGNEGRKYGGTLMMNPAMFYVNKTTAKLVNGVLWVTVPKIPGTNATVDTFGQMLRREVNLAPPTY